MRTCTHPNLGEDEATIANEALDLPRYRNCYHCFMGLEAKPLPPTLRKAWTMGFKIAVKAATIGQIPRYLFLAVQSSAVVAAIVLSFVATNTNSLGSKVSIYASVGPLCLILIINILERFIYWCSHADESGKWNFWADIIRTIVTEIFLYSAFFFTLQGVTTCTSDDFPISEKSVNSSGGDMTIGLALLTLIGTAFVLTAGVMRMYLIVFAVVSLLQARKFNNSNANLSIKIFLYGFCVYSGAQGMAQTLLVVGICLDGTSYLQDYCGTSDLIYKWHLAIFAELIPLCGLFLYFTTTHKLVEEFPIALLLDVSSPQDQRQSINMEVVSIQFKALHSKNMSKTGIQEHIYYPWTSPVQKLLHVMFLTLYAYFLYFMIGIITNSFHTSLQIVSTLAVVLTFVLDFPSLFLGFADLWLSCKITYFLGHISEAFSC